LNSLLLDKALSGEMELEQGSAPGIVEKQI